MILLGIESSCDDTSIALLDCSERGHFIIAEKAFSQIDVHQKYGGVVPEIAGRMHAEKIAPLIEEVLKGQPKPDVIAVTAGPGLITGLIVGVEAARTLSYAWNIPVVATNHISGHVHSVEIVPKEQGTHLRQSSGGQAMNNEQSGNTPTVPLEGEVAISPSRGKQGVSLTQIRFPALALVVSGGHTELILMQSHTDCTILGRTKDDAAGECFDKVASLVGFAYPGGPHISREAVHGNSNAIEFPRPMIQDKSYDFSFSGLKTAALYWLRDHTLEGVIARSDAGATKQSPGEQSPHHEKLHPEIEGIATSRSSARNDTKLTLSDFCASFEQAIIDVLVTKTIRAANEHKPKSIILGGGVSANKKLRETLTAIIEKDFPDAQLHLPPPGYSMDNGAMIAVAGYYQALNKNFTSWQELAVNPNWRIDQKFSSNR